MLVNILNHWDQIASLAINHSLHNGISDNFMLFFSNKLVWVPMYIIIIYFLFKRLGFRNGMIVFISIILTIAACDQFTNLIKNSVCRLRPCYNLFMIDGHIHILERRTNYFGFFSAHSSNSFGFAICSLIGFKNEIKHHNYTSYKIWIFVWAGIVAISRVFVAKHYLGDIIIGAIAGCIIGYIIAIIARTIIRFLDKKPLFYNCDN